MTKKIGSLDQSYAEAQAALDGVVANVRKSLGRKRERHGEKFDLAKAQLDLYGRIHNMPGEAKTILLGTALQRLALVDDDDPFADIADLDFEIDVTHLNDPDDTEEKES